MTHRWYLRSLSKTMDVDRKACSNDIRDDFTIHGHHIFSDATAKHIFRSVLLGCLLF